jgi:hypothetical protein
MPAVKNHSQATNPNKLSGIKAKGSQKNAEK